MLYSGGAASAIQGEGGAGLRSALREASGLVM